MLNYFQNTVPILQRYASLNEIPRWLGHNRVRHRGGEIYKLRDRNSLRNRDQIRKYVYLHVDQGPRRDWLGKRGINELVTQAL